MTQLLGILIVVALIVGFIYVLVRPHWAVVLVIVMFPLEQLVQVYVPGLFVRPWIINVAVGGVALVALLSRVGRRPVFLGMSNPVLWLVLGIYALAITGLLWTPAPDRATEMLLRGVPYHVLLLLVLPLLIFDLQEFNRVIIGTLLAGTLIALLVVLNPQSKVHAGRLMIELGPGGGGMQRGNPLALASLGGTLTFVAALIRFRSAGWLLVGLRAAAIVVGLGLAIRSGSRGQVLAAAVTAILFYPLARQVRNPQQFLLVALGLLTLMVAIFVAFKLFIGIENLSRWSGGLMVSDAGGRWERVTTLLSEWLASPGYWLFGLGPAAFTALHTESYVHNLFAEVLCEEGLVGASLLGLALYLLFRGGRRLWRMNAHDPVMRATASVLLAICFYDLLISLKQGSFLLSPVPFPWLLVLAKLVVVERTLLAMELQEAAALEEEHEQEQAFGELEPAL